MGKRRKRAARVVDGSLAKLANRDWWSVDSSSRISLVGKMVAIKLELVEPGEVAAQAKALSKERVWF